MQKRKGDPLRDYKRGTNMATIGLELVLSIAVGFFGGRYLDDKLGTAPWLSVVGFLFGVAAAVKAVHRAWTQMQTVARIEEREQGNPEPLYFTERSNDPSKRSADSKRPRPSGPEEGS
jgi:F0F1-type ATP synthase assembly protein I